MYVSSVVFWFQNYKSFTSLKFICIFSINSQFCSVNQSIGNEGNLKFGEFLINHLKFRLLWHFYWDNERIELYELKNWILLK